MNSATMIHNDCYDEEDDVLSLKDLQMYDQTAIGSTRTSPKTSSTQDQHFEFFPGTVDHQDNDYLQNGRDYLTGSLSFRLPERATRNVIPVRSVSHRDDLGSPRYGGKVTKSVKKVNISKLTSKSDSKSKRMMSMFRPVKFMPEMEMSSLRERQLRRAPSQMFPVMEGGGGGKPVTGRAKNTVTCRARLNSVFERSIACLRI